MSFCTGHLRAPRAAAGAGDLGGSAASGTGARPHAQGSDHPSLSFPRRRLLVSGGRTAQAPPSPVSAPARRTVCVGAQRSGLSILPLLLHPARGCPSCLAASGPAQSRAPAGSTSRATLMSQGTQNLGPLLRWQRSVFKGRASLHLAPLCVSAHRP